jgi:hypothetical protein
MTFPAIIIALFTLAAIEQLVKGNVPLAVFYGLSALINVNVLFLR